MPKESESFNTTDNNSSEMIVISPNPRIEEILISNQPSTSGEALSYEARLNEKLKDLDLYEEDMTIQQKEELLEVVVASWETAEKEKTRRQFFQDYMSASEAFCNDQFEFTLQESEEISNAIQSAEIQLPSESSEANISSFSGDFDAGTVIVNGNLDLQFDTVASTFDSLSVESKNEKILSSVQSFNEEDSYTSNRECKTPSSRRKRSRRGKAASFKEPLEVTVVSASEAKYTDHRESDNQLLEKIKPSWKPCLSPKDTPLMCSRRPMPEEKEGSSCEFSEEAYSQKVYSLVKEFDFARQEAQKTYIPQWSYSKPYHLTRRGLFVKKSGKLDKYDLTIGATDSTKSGQSNPAFAPHSINRGESSKILESNIRTSRGEMFLSQTNSPMQTTRSGLRYGFQRTASDVKAECVDVEILSEPSILPCVTVLDSGELAETVAVPVDGYFDKDAVFNSLLPKYKNLCSDTDSVANGPSPRKKAKSSTGAKSKGPSVKKSNSEGPNHSVNSSVDSDSSDNSSVIDVETVVDDEINEFVLKRKLLQNSPTIEKGTTPKRAKKS